MQRRDIPKFATMVKMTGTDISSTNLRTQRFNGSSTGPLVPIGGVKSAQLAKLRDERMQFYPMPRGYLAIVVRI